MKGTRRYSLERIGKKLGTHVGVHIGIATIAIGVSILGSDLKADLYVIVSGAGLAVYSFLKE